MGTSHNEKGALIQGLIQGLRFCAPTQGARIQPLVRELDPIHPNYRISCAATKTQHS